MWIYFIFFFVFLQFCFAYENILLHLHPNVTHNENNQFFNLNYLNDGDLTTFYSTNSIHPNTTAIINYKLNSIYCIDTLELYWMNIPLYFMIKIFENNIINIFEYVSEENNNEYYTSYQSDNTHTEIKLCENNIYANEIKIFIINNTTNYVHYMIRDIQAMGYDVLNELIDIQPRRIPINSIPEFHIDVRQGQEIRISHNNICEDTYHLDNYKFTESREYKLCLEKFIQPISIFVDTLFNITPFYLHISSFTKLYLVTNNSFSSIIGLSNRDCELNTIDSISNIIYDTVDFFEQGNNEGIFDICYSFNNLWGNTKQQLHLVRPLIYSITGCENIGDTTVNCPTNGGENMTIKGIYFFDYYNNPIVRYGDYISDENILLDNTTIVSKLPEGTGKDVKVSVRFETESESKTLLSYKKPEISYVSGCTNDYPKIKNCPNNNYFNINIIGNNFGLDLATILIGSTMCQNITHISHSNISCHLYGNRGINNVVYVIQHKGDISDGQTLISYQECDKGYELIDNICKKCDIGYYKDKISDNLCMLCPDGTYTNSTGNIECQKCIENSLSNELRSKCYCKEGYFMDLNNNCIECDNLDFFGNIIYSCKNSKLTIQTLENEKGYWRMHDTTVMFYKCRLEDNCPSRKIINNTVNCKTFHTGILCDFCVHNYAKDNNGDCQECGDPSGIVSGLIVVTIIIYILFNILTLIVGNKYLNKAVENNVDVDLVNEGENTEEQEEEEEDDEFMIQILQKVKILITYLQINSILSINLNIKWPNFMRKVMIAFKSINLEVFDIVGLDYRCQVNFDFYHIFIFKMFMLPIVCTLSLFSYGIVYWYGKVKHNEDKFFELIQNRFIYTLVLITFMLYPGVCNTILQLYKCEQIEDVWYLTQDLSLECFDSTWDKYAVGAVFCMILYILGIPYYFYKKLKYYRDEEMLEHKEIMYKYGFLYLGYIDSMWWFEILELMRKTILSASIIYLEESATRIIVAMIVCGVYLLYLAYNQPQKEEDNTFLSVLSATELFLLLFCGLILEVQIDIQDKYNEVAFDGVMFVIFIFLLFIGNYQIIRSLKKHNIFTMIYHRCCKIYNKISENIEKCINMCRRKRDEYNIERIMYIIRESSL